MLRRMLAAAALLAGSVLGLANAQAPSRAAPSPDCADDRGVDRCSPEQHRRVLDLFVMKPIEEHARAGDQVRRAFYVDGYGRDMIALSFVRAPGRDPMLSVHWPSSPDRPARAPEQVLVPAAIWEGVLAQSRYFDRELQPIATADSSGVFCLHSWVYTVESHDPEREGGSRASLRRKVADACADGLAEPYANHLARVALAAIPYCAALDPQSHRNEASMLRACALLEGDRLAAAQAYNQAMRLNQTHLPRSQVAALDVFHQRAVLDWQGQRSGGERGDADDAWVARRQAAGGFLFFTRAVGESATRVRVEGFLTGHRTESGREIDLRAPVTFVFGPDPAKRLLAVEQAIVGPFAQTED